MISLIHNLLFQNFRRSEQRFFRDAQDLEKRQRSLLQIYLKKNKSTAYGKKYNFQDIQSYEEYSRRIPITTYDDYQDFVQNLTAGQQNQLSASPVSLLEPTSGSSSGRKLIPYTQELQQEYMAGVKPWLADLYRSYPSLKKGSSYWTITPMKEELKNASPIPIGFDDDSSYFGILAPLVQRLYPVPKKVKLITSQENFRYISSLLLLQDSSLALISLWNPSFLTLLSEYIHKQGDRLIRSLIEGRLIWPQGDPGLGTWGLKRKGSFMGKRADLLESVLSRGYNLEPLWPNLQVISCWRDGHSGSLIPGLRKYFPRVDIQAKGLLATEGIVSIPMSGAVDPVLACRSHFFEFLDCEKGSIHPAWSLSEGRHYRPLLTTGGGLYRYDLGDEITITGWYKALPMIRFLGRANTVDLAGEKMSESFVAHRLPRLFPEHSAPFMILAPWEKEGKRGYRLYCSMNKNCNVDDGNIQNRLEELLLENYHYQYARKLGQLEKVEIFPITSEGQEQYLSFQESRGQRLGDIKIPALYLKTDLELCFPDITKIGSKRG